MAIKCSNCGGDMTYQIKDRNLKCNHCDESISINEVIVSKNAQEVSEDYAEEQIETTIFQCPECGAEIRSFEEESTIYCSYCGKQTFKKEKENSIKPKYIVPFEKDKLDVKNAYKQFISKKRFVPKDLKDEKCIQEFRGIYIPYWSSTYTTDDTFVYNGHRSYTRGNYDYYETYDVEVQVDGEMSDITFDASLAFDDSIAQEISPFHTDEQEEFHEGFVAGFYADKESINPEIYEETMNSMLLEKIKDKITNKTNRTAVHISTLKENGVFDKQNQYLLLLPVWFLTYRNKDRVSYSVMNGQTGKFSMDLPVDKKSFFAFAGVLSVLLSMLFIFLFTTLFASMGAVSTSWWSLVMMLISTFILYKETNTIYLKETHLENIGKQTKFDIFQFSKKNQTKIVISVIGIFLFLIFFFNGFSSGSGTTRPTLTTVFITIPIVIGEFVLQKKIKKVSLLKEKRCSFFSLLVSVIAIVLYFISFVNDYFYYSLALLGVIAIIINAFGCISGFDYLTSRPIPNFYERKGANNVE